MFRRSASDASTLNPYRRLIELRRKTRALHAGEIANVRATGNILSYERSDGAQRFAVTLNLGSEPQQVEHAPAEIVLSARADRAAAPISPLLPLGASEGVVARLADRAAEDRRALRAYVVLPSSGSAHTTRARGSLSEVPTQQ